jgi:hypothetical protein
MNLAIVQRILGLLLMLFSLTMIPLPQTSRRLAIQGSGFARL